MTRSGLSRSTTARMVCAAGLASAALSFGAPAARPVVARQAGGWTLVHARPATGKYEDFAFPTPKLGWLVSASGEILHTLDGGTTWASQATGKGRLRSIDFLDAQRGFAGTLTGVLWATKDGGTTWTDITGTLPRAPKGFCGLAHVGDTVHAVGRYQADASDYYFSRDAGKTWQWTDMRELAQAMVEVVFLDASVGFIGGMSPRGAPAQGPAVLLKTTDGGKSWRTVFTHDGGRGFVWKIMPMDGTLIYASLQSQDGTYRIARSRDTGETWEVLTAVTGRPQGPAVQGVGFIDEQTGSIGGFFRGMFATTDGGKTWTAVQPEDGTINRFERVGRTIFTAGSRGILRYEAR